jgi:ubiquitin carboxyl-terminal hydrolase L5
VQVEELYALDAALFASLQPIHGLVFLFPFTGDQASRSAARQGTILATPPPKLFAPAQVIQNACATQALLSIVLNAPGVSLPAELSDLLAFTEDFDPMTKGLAISNSETIRSVHNSFSPQQFVVENAPARDEDKEPPYHFISFIPFEGRVFELDGLAGGPRQHGAYNETTTWLDVVTPVIESRMAEYSAEGEIRFTLLAVCDDIAARLKAESAAAPGDAELAARAAREAEKRAAWKKDNARRKHNWLPFIVQSLKSIAEAGLIDKVIDDATKRKEKRFKDEQEAKQATADKMQTG